ncbi:MAG: tetratricopeptide repeat protein [Candidatus Saganbacteria bacterium]|nr:tetratricopeptide repeat protein [Candidatus Saganbacteria bacterium]
MRHELREIRQALKQNPDDPLALRAIGLHYLTEGRYKQARDHFDQAVKLCPRLMPEILLDYERLIDHDPKEIGTRLCLAGFDIYQGDLEAAILEIEEALEVNPKNIEAYNVLGKILVKQGRIDEVIALLERSLAFGVRDVSLSEILANAYLEKGRIKEAIRFYNDVLRYRPGDKRTLRVLGELYGRIEDYNEAAKSYQAMFSDDPEVAREVMQRLEDLLKKQEGSIFIREILADIYMRSLRPEAAVEKLLEIIRLDPQKLGPMIDRLKHILKNYPDHPETILALAEGLRRQGSFSEAVEYYHDLLRRQPEAMEQVLRGYQEVIEACPEQILSRTYLAEAYLFRNQLKEALEQFQIMLELDPSAAETVVKRCREIIKSQPDMLMARLVLGKAYLVTGDVQRAAIEAEGIIAADKGFSPAYVLLGEAYFKLNMCRKAVNILGQALEREPYNLEVQEKYREVKIKELELETDNLKERISEDPWRVSQHLDLARLYLQRGLRDEAIRELQIAQKDQARAPFAFNMLGCVYRSEGLFEQAAAQFSKALDACPAELADLTKTLRFNLATTWEARGEVGKALQLYEAVLQEDLDFSGLKRRIKYLKSTSYKSMKVKSIITVLARPGAKQLVYFWGRESGSGRPAKKEEFSQSFGQDHNAAGFDFFMKGMISAAQEKFQLAVQLDVKFASALNNLAVTLLHDGKLHEARSRLEDTVDIEPNSVVFRNNLGLVYSLLGQPDQAAYEVEKAYTLDPESNAVCLNLGDIAYARKDVRRAIDLYRRPGSCDLLAELAEQRLRFKVPEHKAE